MMSEGGVFRAEVVYIRDSEEDKAADRGQEETLTQCEPPAGHMTLPQLSPPLSAQAGHTALHFVLGPAAMETAVGKHGGFSRSLSPPLVSEEVRRGLGLKAAHESQADRPSPPESPDLPPTLASSRESVLSDDWSRDRRWPTPDPCSSAALSRTISPCSSVRSGVFSPEVVRVRRHALAPGSTLLRMDPSGDALSCDGYSLCSSPCPLSPRGRHRTPPTRLSLLTAILRKGRLPILSSSLQRPYSPCWPINTLSLATCKACSAASSLASIPLELTSRAPSSASTHDPALGHSPGNGYAAEPPGHVVPAPRTHVSPGSPPTPQYRHSASALSDRVMSSPPPPTTESPPPPSVSSKPRPSFPDLCQPHNKQHPPSPAASSLLSSTSSSLRPPCPSPDPADSSQAFVAQISRPVLSSPAMTLSSLSPEPTPVHSQHNMKHQTNESPLHSSLPDPPLQSSLPDPPLHSSIFDTPLPSSPPGPPLPSSLPGPPLPSSPLGPPLPSSLPGPPLPSSLPGPPLPSSLPTSPPDTPLPSSFFSSASDLPLHPSLPIPKRGPQCAQLINTPGISGVTASSPSGPQDCSSLPRPDSPSHTPGIPASSCHSPAPPLFSYSPAITTSSQRRSMRTTPPPSLPNGSAAERPRPRPSRSPFPTPGLLPSGHSPSRYTPLSFLGSPSPEPPNCIPPSPPTTPDHLTLSPSPAPPSRTLTLSPSLSQRSTPSPRPGSALSDCSDVEGIKRKPHKIKLSYKALAAIPTNTLLLEQQAIDDQVEREGELQDSSDSPDREDPHLKMCSPAQLRQQSEELYAVIDEVLEDPISMRQPSPALRHSRERLDRGAAKKFTSPPRSLGRETKYAAYHLQSPEKKVVDAYKTKPGVIRPVTASPRLMVKDDDDDDEEEYHRNPFRQYMEELSINNDKLQNQTKAILGREAGTRPTQTGSEGSNTRPMPDRELKPTAPAVCTPTTLRMEEAFETHI